MSDDALYNLFLLLLATIVVWIGAWDVKVNGRKEMRNGIALIAGFTMYALAIGWFLGLVRLPPPTLAAGYLQFGICAVIGYLLALGLITIITRRRK